ncbi:ABC transporter permease [Streptomyces sp. F63]|uniref:ABC transporter permease n=1 Tax=Streptomyces sp. F63 TaxID=2824887 RepID=UPI001B38FA3C|nr:ABC transporter permease [Streptomyces sp. F63]MBQ0986106.1 ABC transporter permease [Streptomyces sp. F63]
MTVLSAAKRALTVLGLPAALFTVWWFATADSTDFYFPALRDILAAFGTVWTGERLTTDVLPSLLRLAEGYVLASAAGIALGVLIGTKPAVRDVLEPVLELFRAIPPPVLVPVIMLFAGIGDTMKVLVIASGCLWPVLLNTVEGVRSADEVLSDTCRAYGITGAARLRHFVLPGAGPQIVTGMRQALSIGIILMVISEMFAASNGLGFTVVQFQRSFAIPEMWSGVLLLGILGFLLSLLFRFAENRALAWYHGLRRAQRSS